MTSQTSALLPTFTTGTTSNTLPDLPPIPAPLIWLVSIFTLLGLILAVIIYFASFPPTLRCPNYAISLAARITGWTRKLKTNGGSSTKGKYVKLANVDDTEEAFEMRTGRCPSWPRLTEGASSSSRTSSENRLAEFEWILQRIAFDDESTTSPRQKQRRSQSSPAGSARSSTDSLAMTRRGSWDPVLSQPGDDRHNGVVEGRGGKSGRGRGRPEADSRREAADGDANMGLWTRIDCAMDSVAEWIVKYSVSDRGTSAEQL